MLTIIETDRVKTSEKFQLFPGEVWNFKVYNSLSI